MVRRPPGSTRTDTLVPDTTRYRSQRAGRAAPLGAADAEDGAIPQRQRNHRGGEGLLVGVAVQSHARLRRVVVHEAALGIGGIAGDRAPQGEQRVRAQIGSATWRARVCQHVSISVVAESVNKQLYSNNTTHTSAKYISTQ